MNDIKFKNIKVTKSSKSIGAFIEGVQLDKYIDEYTVNEIYRAFLKYQVIFFRNQYFTPEKYFSFAKNIGVPIIYPFVKGLEDIPEITPILKKKSDKNNFGGVWHSDTTYLKQPPKATMLYALEVPKKGGDTEFSNQYLAYEKLSTKMKKFLKNKKAYFVSNKVEASKTRTDLLNHSSNNIKNNNFESIHPVIRTHPETNKKSLYVNIAHTTRFTDMSEEDSYPILKFLFLHQIKYDFIYRFKWEKGSLAIWDNRCVMHNPINDYQGSRRLMHRITFEGDKPE